MSVIPEGRILITGAAGFIGSATVWALNVAGCDNVVVCDRLGRDDRFLNLVPLRFHDFLDADDLLVDIVERGPRALSGIRTVIHLGACSATTERDAQFLLRNNVEYTKKLAEASLAAGCRFVYASSAATYGAREDELDDALPLDQLRPLNMYAYSKQLFDVYAQRMGWLQHIVGVKYFNVFGPNEGHKGDMRSLVAKSYRDIQAGNPVSLFQSHRPDFADGEQCRDFIYVKDAVAATLFLAANPCANGIVNVGSGVATTWNTLIRAVYDGLGIAPNIQYIPMPEALHGKYQYSTRANLTRLRAAGYTANMMPIAAAVRDYLGYLGRGACLDPNDLVTV